MTSAGYEGDDAVYAAWDDVWPGSVARYEKSSRPAWAPPRIWGHVVGWMDWFVGGEVV